MAHFQHSVPDDTQPAGVRGHPRADDLCGFSSWREAAAPGNLSRCFAASSTSAVGVDDLASARRFCGELLGLYEAPRDARSQGRCLKGDEECRCK